jgi:hypothetical protein
VRLLGDRREMRRKVRQLSTPSSTTSGANSAQREPLATAVIVRSSTPTTARHILPTPSIFLDLKNPPHYIPRMLPRILRSEVQSGPFSHATLLRLSPFGRPVKRTHS